MRIGIITFHRAYNCGAMLQAWALYITLKKLGHEVQFLESNELGRIVPCSPWSCRKKNAPFIWRVRSAVYRLLQTLIGKVEGVKTGVLYDKFREQYLPESDCPVDAIEGRFDAVIIGSDQVLNPSINGWTSYFIGEGISDRTPKIMYAGSAGDCVLPISTKEHIDAVLSRFCAVSVREPYNAYEVVLDPTLLLRADDYAPLYPSRDPNRINEPFIFVYTCTCSDFEISLSRAVARELNLRLVISNPWGRYLRKDVREMVDWMSPSLMLKYINESQCVIAGSFHATVLSVLFNKPVVSVSPHVNGNESRSAAFLRRCGLEARMVDPNTEIQEVVRQLTSPICSDINKWLGSNRAKSLHWLVSALRKCGEKHD